MQIGNLRHLKENQKHHFMTYIYIYITISIATYEAISSLHRILLKSRKRPCIFFQGYITENIEENEAVSLLQSLEISLK